MWLLHHQQKKLKPLVPFTRGQFMALGVECHNSCFSRNIAGSIHNSYINRT